MNGVHPRHATRLTATLIVLASLVFFLTACAFDDEGWDEPWYVSEPYFSQDCFAEKGGRITYNKDDLRVSVTGVDVSDHQGFIDWQAVAADGIDFAFIRIGYRGNTEGYLHADAQFDQNLFGARDAGLACGTYFYSQAINEEEAREEAQFTLDLLGGRELDYPIVFDYERNDGMRISGVDDATATACARAFRDIIEGSGYEVMLYGNAYDLQYLNLSELSDCEIWFAQYASSPSRSDVFTIWQYTSSGRVDGIDGPTDLNLDLSEAVEAATSE